MWFLNYHFLYFVLMKEKNDFFFFYLIAKVNFSYIYIFNIFNMGYYHNILIIVWKDLR